MANCDQGHWYSWDTTKADNVPTLCCVTSCFHLAQIGWKQQMIARHLEKLNSVYVLRCCRIKLTTNVSKLEKYHRCSGGVGAFIVIHNLWSVISKLARGSKLIIWGNAAEWSSSNAIQINHWSLLLLFVQFFHCHKNTGMLLHKGRRCKQMPALNISIGEKTKWLPHYRGHFHIQFRVWKL